MPKARAGPPPPPQPIPLLTVLEVLQLPDPDWLIEGLIEQGAFTVLFGAPESGKSLLALDVALSVATGRPWQGRRVKKAGPVVYVAGEGGRGFKRRIKAWLQEHKLQDVPDARFVSGPVQLLNAQEVQDLLSAVAALPVTPVLIVLDTLARCFVGGEENASQDMSQAVAAVGRLIQGTGAAVLLLHHPGREGDHERGHSSLRGSLDGSIQLKRDGKSGVITVKNEKHKDEKFQPIFSLAPRCRGGGGQATVQEDI